MGTKFSLESMEICARCSLYLRVARHSMRVSKLLKNAFYLALSYLFISCEGFKFISVENQSKSNITVMTKVEHPKIYRSMVDTFISLPPDSTLLIPTYFGPLYIFNEKIKQEEIKFSYLKIISETDTIAANNKTELFKLLKRKRNVGKIIVK